MSSGPQRASFARWSGLGLGGADEEVGSGMTRPRPVSRSATTAGQEAAIPPVPAPRGGSASRRLSPWLRPARVAQPELGTTAHTPPPPVEVRAAPPVSAPADPDQAAVWELVRRAQQGDAEGFGLLYDRYVDLVFRFVHHRVGDRATAEDVTSETFVRALRRIDSLSFRGRDVGAWLVTIARNIVFDHVKSSRYRLEVATADMRDADRATDGPEDAVLQSLSHAAVLAGVAQLSDEQRECLVLRFLKGLSIAETAAAMGKKDGAVKALQHRAIRRLATLLPDGL
jgi:RNA polymerase sigma-70 factor, ECF subfamily